MSGVLTMGSLDPAFAAATRVDGEPVMVDLRSVEFVDLFEGRGLGENERSLTVRFSYRSDDRTLVEEEVNEAHQAILGPLAEKLGVRQRN